MGELQGVLLLRAFEIQGDDGRTAAALERSLALGLGGQVVPDLSLEKVAALAALRTGDGQRLPLQDLGDDSPTE